MGELRQPSSSTLHPAQDNPVFTTGDRAQASMACRGSDKARDTARQPEAAHARAEVYHALAETLAGPVAGIYDLLLDAATAGAQVLGSDACRRAALILAEFHEPDPEALRKGYIRVITSPGRRPVALYESLHRQGCLAGSITWNVERYYESLGLAPANGEPPDYASVELAFLGHLAAAEAEARMAGNGQLVARMRAQQRHFLRLHAGAWLPEVGVALAAADNPFYAVVGRLLSGFLGEELNGRKRDRQLGSRLPALKDTAACTLCGLCVGSCPFGALGVIESATETALTLNPSQCIGCDRCMRICPEEVLVLSSDIRTSGRAGVINGADSQVLRRSPRTACPNCGRPTVSQAELDGVFARLQPDPATWERLCLCVECKSWSA